MTGGSLCTAQGVLKQVGDVAVALTCVSPSHISPAADASFVDLLYVPISYQPVLHTHARLKAIALQTFTVLVLRWREPKWTSSVVIAAIWIFVALAVGVGSATHPSDYYSDTGYCKQHSFSEYHL